MPIHRQAIVLIWLCYQWAWMEELSVSLALSAARKRQLGQILVMPQKFPTDSINLAVQSCITQQCPSGLAKRDSKTLPSYLSEWKVEVMYILLNGIQILIFHNQYLPLLMLDWEFSSEKSLSFSAGTDTSSLCAPLQHPLDNEELPPELTLDGSGWCAKDGRACAPAATRKRSIDQPYSILGFIERRISDRRGRVNSQELNKPRTHCY